MNTGYIENTETGERKEIIVNYHQPLRLLIVCLFIGGAIGALGRYEFYRGVKAFDKQQTQVLDDLGLLIKE